MTITQWSASCTVGFALLLGSALPGYGAEPAKPTAPKAEPSAAAPAVATPPAPIRIGIVGPMNAAPGEQAWNGATLAAEEINKAGGIKVGTRGRPVELVKVDSNEIRTIPGAAKAVDTAIVKSKVDFLVGGYRDESMLAMQDAAMAKKKIFLGVGATTPELGARVEKEPAKYKYWFRVGPLKATDLNQSLFSALSAIANQLRSELKTKSLKVGILAERTTHAEGLVKGAEEALPRMEFQLAGTWRPPVTATDLTQELEAVKRSGAQIVLVFLSGDLGAVLGRQWNELQVPAIPIGHITAAQQDGYWAATAQKGAGVVVLRTYGDAALTSATVPFVTAYRERFKSTPGPTAAAYDAVKVLRAALEQAGSATPDAVAAALEKTDAITTFGRLAFDKRHDPIYGPSFTTGVAVQWQDGAAVPVWPNGWRDVKYEGMKALRLPPGLKK